MRGSVSERSQGRVQDTPREQRMWSGGGGGGGGGGLK